MDGIHCRHQRRRQSDISRYYVYQVYPRGGVARRDDGISDLRAHRQRCPHARAGRLVILMAYAPARLWSTTVGVTTVLLLLLFFTPCGKSVAAAGAEQPVPVLKPEADARNPEGVICGPGSKTSGCHIVWWIPETDDDAPRRTEGETGTYARERATDEWRQAHSDERILLCIPGKNSSTDFYRALYRAGTGDDYNETQISALLDYIKSKSVVAFNKMLKEQKYAWSRRLLLRKIQELIDSGEIERETLPVNDCGLFSVHEFLGCRWREFITALPSPYLPTQKQMVTRHSELQGLNSSNTMTFSITRDPIKRVISAYKNKSSCRWQGLGSDMFKASKITNNWMKLFAEVKVGERSVWEERDDACFPSFASFVNIIYEIMLAGKQGAFDNHFQQQSAVCR